MNNATATMTDRTIWAIGTYGREAPTISHTRYNTTTALTPATVTSNADTLNANSASIHPLLPRQEAKKRTAPVTQAARDNATMTPMKSHTHPGGGVNGGKSAT